MASNSSAYLQLQTRQQLQQLQELQELLVSARDKLNRLLTINKRFDRVCEQLLEKFKAAATDQNLENLLRALNQVIAEELQMLGNADREISELFRFLRMNPDALRLMTAAQQRERDSICGDFEEQKRIVEKQHQDKWEEMKVRGSVVEAYTGKQFHSIY
ncbi:hypothetical protein SCHPADRAFT_936139 [Schizopora paradoxa]|uniref:Uncharacterized protein n=1 Tax=Schizopora paradoxa TaxID=27342 RepID=A0A0H2S3C6_9AGAM|nr:hypothetical protein SCHPADRAFT_936139 [Schizopora paradoxa]